ncbi:MAG TPA: hypothetical protein VFA35_04250 [Burkholderiaceae bacterium]|nr:hypothetical protein [Burkholderiaceae bacterium]
MTAAGVELARDPVAWLQAHGGWLFERELGACIVGSHALAIACRRAGIAAPTPRDLDLAWSLDVDEGRALLERRGVFVPTTDGSVQRGTLALKIDHQRLEVTAFRDARPRNPLAQRIADDAAARDMTVGALAVELATGVVHDPTGGLGHWQQRRIVPVGDPGERVREHPVRWLRYYRKAHEWSFELDRSVRRLRLPPHVLASVPREALGAELRAALLYCASPGRFFVDLHEIGVLAWLAPELDLQFDGRPAGPQRWHPEIAQSLHLVLALEWAAANSQHLDERDRLAVMVAVLCHDLGKGFTDAAELPGHPGHERLGVPHVHAFLRRFPGLLDRRGAALAQDVCALHVEIRGMHELRPGTLARLYDQHFRARDYPIEPFALAVAADSGGRLGLADAGRRVHEQVASDLRWLRRCCEAIDATALRTRCADLAAFRAALHEARARALGGGPPRAQKPDAKA